MTNMTPAEKAADGLSLHGGIDEHSLMLYLRPELVASDYRQAPPVNGANYDEAFATARKEGWPGYLGAPHLATAAFGERIWTSFAAATVKTAVAILDGKDPSTYGRYLTYLKTLPLYREWIASADSRDAVGNETQRLAGSTQEIVTSSTDASTSASARMRLFAVGEPSARTCQWA
jgi:hypothetical protein